MFLAHLADLSRLYLARKDVDLDFLVEVIALNEQKVFQFRGLVVERLWLVQTNLNFATLGHLESHLLWGHIQTLRVRAFEHLKIQITAIIDLPGLRGHPGYS